MVLCYQSPTFALHKNIRMVQVFKFGSASVNSVDSVQNLAGILKFYQDQKLVVVISAMGKTTNALEKVAESYYNNKKEDALKLVEQVKRQHLTTAKYLLVTHYLACEAQLRDFFTEVEWLLHDKPIQGFDYYHDQIVCCGELLSTAIISHFLNEMGINNKWVDVRDIIRTNNNFRNANVDWELTEKNVKKHIQPLLDTETLVITQGLIGSTEENESTTLGHESGDYSAAIFANMLNAESQTIWQEEEYIMNADSGSVSDAQSLPELDYTEIIEMAYYGTQIIHPKTIQPLQNKSIPLYVKSFFKPDQPGTIIHKKATKQHLPIVLFKRNQVMVELKSNDFSFTGTENTTLLYKLFNQLCITPTLSQNGAISITFTFDHHKEKISQLAAEASTNFDVQITPELTLLTIFHYDHESLQNHIEGKSFLIKQQTADSVKLLYSEAN